MASSSLSVSRASPSCSSHSRRCCRCSWTGKCLRCACVRSGALCSDCFPGEVGNCHNNSPRDSPRYSTPSPSRLLQVSDSSSSTSSSAPGATPPSPPSRPRRRCRCNGTAKCLRCACVRGGVPCSGCLPGEEGNCHNALPQDAMPTILPQLSACNSSVSSSQFSQGTSSVE